MTNFDKNKVMWNQNADHRPNECVGITRADIIGNIFGVKMLPDFSYASDLFLQRITPFNGGEAAAPGVAADIVYGALPFSAFPEAVQDSDTLTDNFTIYTQQMRILAQQYAMKGSIPLNTYEDIIYYTQSTGIGANIAFKWSQAFENPQADNSLPMPSGSFSYHDTAEYIPDDPRGLGIKSWQGTEYGDNGYVYMNKQVYTESVTGAWGYDPKGWRWWSLVKIGLQYPQALNDIIPLLYATANQTNS